MAKLKEYSASQLAALDAAQVGTSANSFAAVTEKTVVLANDLIMLESTGDSNAQRQAYVGELIVRTACSTVDKTSDYTLTSGDCNGTKTFTNNGAAGAIKFTLPTAAAGLQVEIMNAAGQQIDIDAGSSQIAVTGTTASLVRSSTAGDSVLLTCVSSNMWVSSVNKGILVRPFLGLGGSASYGFQAGGYNGSASTTTIDRFSLSSSSGGSSWGVLAQDRYASAGCSSSAQGFVAGGRVLPSNTERSTIEKFDFSSNTTATSHGDLSLARFIPSGESSSTTGYASGGAIISGYTVQQLIDKFAFSSNTTATSHGNLASVLCDGSGASSETEGFHLGAFHQTNYSTSIQKFAFASNTTGTNWATLTTNGSREWISGQSSITRGYSTGGTGPLSTMDSFVFSAGGSATSWGSLTVARQFAAGQSGPSKGYSSGGMGSNVIDAFDFASSSNAVSWGSLTSSRGTSGTGQQG